MRKSGGMSSFLYTGRMIEVEIRGVVADEARGALTALLEREGSAPKVKERVLIDYSTLMEKNMRERTKDIRVRATNGVSEIIVKLGAYGGSDARKELSLPVGEHSFDTLVQVMAALGYERGMLTSRTIYAYAYAGVEITLVHVHDGPWQFEMEKMVEHDADVPQAQKDLHTLAETLGLTVMTKEEWVAHIEYINQHVPSIRVFDIKEYTEGTFAKTFGI